MARALQRAGAYGNITASTLDRAQPSRSELIAHGSRRLVENVGVPSAAPDLPSPNLAARRASRREAPGLRVGARSAPIAAATGPPQVYRSGRPPAVSCPSNCRSSFCIVAGIGE